MTDEDDYDDNEEGGDKRNIMSAGEIPEQEQNDRPETDNSISETENPTPIFHSNSQPDTNENTKEERKEEGEDTEKDLRADVTPKIINTDTAHVQSVSDSTDTILDNSQPQSVTPEVQQTTTQLPSFSDSHSTPLPSFSQESPSSEPELSSSVGLHQESRNTLEGNEREEIPKEEEEFKEEMRKMEEEWKKAAEEEKMKKEEEKKETDNEAEQEVEVKKSDEEQEKVIEEVKEEVDAPLPPAAAEHDQAPPAEVSTNSIKDNTHLFIKEERTLSPSLPIGEQPHPTSSTIMNEAHEQTLLPNETHTPEQPPTIQEPPPPPPTFTEVPSPQPEEPPPPPQPEEPPSSTETPPPPQPEEPPPQPEEPPPPPPQPEEPPPPPPQPEEPPPPPVRQSPTIPPQLQEFRDKYFPSPGTREYCTERPPQTLDKLAGMIIPGFLGAWLVSIGIDVGLVGVSVSLIAVLVPLCYSCCSARKKVRE